VDRWARSGHIFASSGQVRASEYGGDIIDGKIAARRRRLLAVVAVLAATSGVALGVSDPGRGSVASGGRSTLRATPSPTATSTFVTRATPEQSQRWARIGYDRSYKADLVEKLPSPPQLVVLGGSRAQRFEPSVIQRLAGLSAFNFAVHNCRTADAYAISQYLFARSPSTKLHCFYAINATTLVDAPMDQALLYDKRFSQWFPKALLASEKKAEGAPVATHVPSYEFDARGSVVYNGYDRQLAEGITLAMSLRTYLARMVPRASVTSSSGQSLSKYYFRMLLQLYNDHGVKPVLVIMPYHPEALSAFRAVGWQKKLDDLKGYLFRLQRRYQFHLLDYTDISSFGGKPQWFYDGAHVTKQNARLILQQAVKQAPECFR
jgi:hypothetical protein